MTEGLGDSNHMGVSKQAVIVMREGSSIRESGRYKTKSTFAQHYRTLAAKGKRTN